MWSLSRELTSQFSLNTARWPPTSTTRTTRNYTTPRDATLEELLQPRGLIVLKEAIRCFHRGLYVAAVDLLAAASEAAWFTVGAAIQDDAELTRLVSQGQNVADVIHRTGEGISRAGALHRQVLRDLRAQAARFRDLRNYGLHPLGPQQQEQEQAFTEAGAALLFMAAASYFQRLRSALETLRSGRF